MRKRVNFFWRQVPITVNFSEEPRCREDQRHLTV